MIVALATANSIRSIAISALARMAVSAPRVQGSMASQASSSPRPRMSAPIASSFSKRFQRSQDFCRSASMRDCRKHQGQSSDTTAFSTSSKQHQHQKSHTQTKFHPYQRGLFGPPGYPAQAPV